MAVIDPLAVPQVEFVVEAVTVGLLVKVTTTSFADVQPFDVLVKVHSKT